MKGQNLWTRSTDIFLKHTEQWAASLHPHQLTPFQHSGSRLLFTLAADDQLTIFSIVRRPRVTCGSWIQRSPPKKLSRFPTKQYHKGPYSIQFVSRRIRNVEEWTLICLAYADVNDDLIYDIVRYIGGSTPSPREDFRDYLVYCIYTVFWGSLMKVLQRNTHKKHGSSLFSLLWQHLGPLGDGTIIILMEFVI